MNRRFFWRLVLGLSVVALLLFSSMHQLSGHITINMTVVKPEHQQVLEGYARQAERALREGDRAAITALTERIETFHGVWAAVREGNGSLHSHTPLPDDLADKLGFQRKVIWPIHPFMTRVLIGFPLENGNSFVIELPDAMHPRPNTSIVHTVLTVVAPSLVLIVFCWLLYRYIMRPLEALNQSTLKLAAGDLDARVGAQIPAHRKDEITQLARSFDSMAERLQLLIQSQRQLLGDLSHELRTPLTRLELALDQCREDESRAAQVLPRLSRDVQLMNLLVDDALTLAWLESEPVLQREDQFSLTALLVLLCEDAQFEFPSHHIRHHNRDQSFPLQSNQRALAQSIENVLRNALKYSPEDSEVKVKCHDDGAGAYQLSISDSGPGVDEDQLERIFDPFYRTDKARTREQGGFGLGLALVKRQIEGVGGHVNAELSPSGGLTLTMRIPHNLPPAQTSE